MIRILRFSDDEYRVGENYRSIDIENASSPSKNFVEFTGLVETHERWDDDELNRPSSVIMSLPHKCLILDADTEWCEIFAELLSSKGVSEILAISPESDWEEHLSSFSPNLLIMDVPQENPDPWISVISAIAKSGTKVIAVSKAAKKVIVLQSIQNGAIHFIVKGNDLALVEISLDSCLKRTQFVSRPNSAFKPKQFASF